MARDPGPRLASMGRRVQTLHCANAKHGLRRPQRQYWFLCTGPRAIRKAGDGRAPVPGWTGEYDWDGWVPFEQLPQAFNPPAGHIATANNKIVPDDYPYLITHDWDLPYRIERIEAALSEKHKQSIESSTEIQATSSRSLQNVCCR
jgi:Protein related to penicillin acylase